MLSIANNLLVLFLLLLMAMPIYAGNHYLFPSDIIDQSEQVQYDVERENRYKNQRNWQYPNELRTFEKNIYQPEPDQYITSDGQSLYQIEHAKQYQNRNKTSWYKQSGHYKYDDFNANIPPNAQMRQPVYYPMNDFNREAKYPKENYPKQFSNEQSRNIRPPAIANKVQQAEQRQFTRSFRKPVYASDFDADGYITNKRSANMNPYNIPSYNSTANYDWKNDNGKQQVRVQYVPVPVYNVPPGTLPGTIPGIVTPGNMVPGYSHLSPNYDHANKKGKNDKGIYDVMGSQYNPFSGLNIFPGGSNPFDSFYKSYSNNPQKGWPFLSPDAMTPFFSQPDAFLSH